MAPKTRRQYGTGSITERADGKFIGRIEAGYTKTGGRRRLSVIADTKAEARRRLRELERKIAAEGLPEAGTTRVTVKAWSDTWLERHERNVRPKAFITDRGAVRKWIVPTIGHKRLQDLTPGDVHAIHTAIRKAGRSTTTARQAHYTLSGMLKAAVAEGHAVPSRVIAVKAPVEAPNDRQPIPLPDLLRLLETARSHLDGVRWLVALMSGMRQGEVLGLEWSRVDLDSGVMDVSWQLQHLPYLDRKDKSLGFRVPDGYESRHLHAAAHLVRPKTKSGYRMVPLAPAVVDGMRQWHRDAPANPWGLVFSLGGLPVNPRDDRALWSALQAEAEVAHPSGRPYVLHEARHSAATLLLHEGVDDPTVELILGHSDIVTSRRYQRASMDAAHQAMAAVAKRLQLHESSVQSLPKA